MKRFNLLLGILLWLSPFLEGADYLYLGNEYLGSYFKKSWPSFLEKGHFQFPEVKRELTLHARKTYVNGEEKIFYPDGWLNLKFYKPAGIKASLSISTIPNATLRVNVKFRGDKNNVFNYAIPSEIVYNQYSLQEEDIYNTNYNEGLAFKLANVGNIVVKNPQQSGWVYVGIVEDAVNWYSPPGSPSKTMLYLYYRLEVEDLQQFLSWLQSQKFNRNGLGNPIPETDQLIVVPNEDQQEVVRFYISNPNTLFSREFSPNGYFIQIGPNANDWVYLVRSTGALFKMESVDVDRKIIKWVSMENSPLNLQECFSYIKVKKENKIEFGNYNPSNCPVNSELLKNIAGKEMTFYMFVNYGKKSDEWLLFSTTNPQIYKISFDSSLRKEEDAKLGWKRVTECFSNPLSSPTLVKLLPNFNSFIKVSDESKFYRENNLCWELNNKIFNLDSQGISVNNSNSVGNDSIENASEESIAVSEESVNASVISELENQEFSIEKGVIYTDIGVLIIEENDKVFLLSQVGDGLYRKTEINTCFDSVEIVGDTIKIGRLKDECRGIGSSFSSASSSISVVSSTSNGEEYHWCKVGDTMVQIPSSQSCEEYEESSSNSFQVYSSEGTTSSQEILPIPY